MDVEGLGVSHVVGAPDPVDQLTARHNATGVANQHFQKLEFLQRQLHFLTAHRDHVTVNIHAHTTGFENVVEFIVNRR